MLTEALEGREEEGKEEGDSGRQEVVVRPFARRTMCSFSLSLSLVRLDGFWSPDDDPSEISRKGEI